MSARAASAPGAGVLDRLQVLRSAPTPLRGAPAATWTPSPRTGVGPLRVPGPGLQPSSHDTTTTRTDPAGSTLARPDFGPKDGVHLIPVLKEKRDGVIPNVLDPVLKRGSVVMPSEIESDPGRTTTVEMSTDGILAAVPAIDRSFEGPRPSEQIPPDPVVAAGANHVLSVVNTVFEIYDKSGTLLQGPIDLASFFSIGGLSLVFDPLVVYDRFEDRFILVVASDSALLQDSKLHIAFSQSSDPTGGWNKYAIDADAGQPNNNWADYPSIGIDFNAVYLTANMIPRSGSTTNTSIFVYDKRDGYADPPRALDNSHVIDVRGL